MQEYIWFYENTYDSNTCIKECRNLYFLDKIGINLNRTSMMKNDMLYPIAKYNKIEKIIKLNLGDELGIKSIKTIDLIYRLNEQTNFMFHSRLNLLTFKYYSTNEKGDNMTLKFIEYNGKRYSVQD